MLIICIIFFFSNIPHSQSLPPLHPNLKPSSLDRKPIIHNCTKACSAYILCNFLHFSALKEYIRLSKKYYSTEPQEVDFLECAEGARKKINFWVETQTKGKTKETFSVLST